MVRNEFFMYFWIHTSRSWAKRSATDDKWKSSLFIMKWKVVVHPVLTYILYWLTSKVEKRLGCSACTIHWCKKHHYQSCSSSSGCISSTCINLLWIQTVAKTFDVFFIALKFAANKSSKSVVRTYVDRRLNFLPGIFQNREERKKIKSKCFFCTNAIAFDAFFIANVNAPTEAETSDKCLLQQTHFISKVITKRDFNKLVLFWAKISFITTEVTLICFSFGELLRGLEWTLFHSWNAVAFISSTTNHNLFENNALSAKLNEKLKWNLEPLHLLLILHLKFLCLIENDHPVL